LGAADVKFLKQIIRGDKVIADARVEEIQGKKHWVAVSVTKQDDIIFQGMFTCFALKNHVLG
jgi:predicted thioesterase